MPPAAFGQGPAPGGALDQALLQKVGFDDLFQGVALFGQCRRQGFDTYRAAAVMLGHGGEIAPVHGIETAAIDLETGERLIGDLGGDGPVAGHRGEITDPAQEPVGDPGRAPRAAGDFPGGVIGELETEDAGAAAQDPFKFVGVSEENGSLSVPVPGPTTLLSTNQIMSATVIVTVAAALVAFGVPLSVSV